MKSDELLPLAQDGLTVRRVFGEPHSQDGITVIPAARILGGGGGGSGQVSEGQEGEGGGFGIVARPAGAFVIKDGRVRWVPAFDVNRALLLAAVLVFAALRPRRRAHR
jgi:uncharacterized spore protein YtfJ